MSVVIVPPAFPQVAALIVDQEKKSDVGTKVTSFLERSLLIMMCLIADLLGRPIIRAK